jgi:hypothetical protein
MYTDENTGENQNKRGKKERQRGRERLTRRALQVLRQRKYMESMEGGPL